MREKMFGSRQDASAAHKYFRFKPGVKNELRDSAANRYICGVRKFERDIKLAVNAAEDLDEAASKQPVHTNRWELT